MPASSLVRVETHEDGRIAEIVLNRPEAMNAVSTDMALAITDACREVASTPRVSVTLLVSSHPTAFCVGADLKERHRLTDHELVMQRPIARGAYNGVLDLPMPTIAVVEGHALGGGYELALSCDLIVAGEQATFALPEVSVGVIPAGGGTQLLSRRVGYHKAADVIFTARRLTATETVALGGADRLAAAGTAHEVAMSLARDIAAHSPVGLRNAKRALRLGSDVDLRTGLEVEDAAWRATAFSGDRAEGVAAFAEKRRPDWPGC